MEGEASQSSIMARTYGTFKREALKKNKMKNLKELKESLIMENKDLSVESAKQKGIIDSLSKEVIQLKLDKAIAKRVIESLANEVQNLHKELKTQLK